MAPECPLGVQSPLPRRDPDPGGIVARVPSGDQMAHGPLAPGGDPPGRPGPYGALPGERTHPAPWRPPSSGPPTARSGLAWIVFAVLGFIVGQVVALLVIGLAAQVTGNTARLSSITHLAAPPAWYVASSLVGLWVGFFVGPLLASLARGTRRLAADLGIAFRPIDVVGVPIGIVGQFLVTVLYLPFISHLHNFDAPTTKLTGGAHGGAFAVIAILTVVGAPFFEELFFRGLLLRGFLAVTGAWQHRSRRLLLPTVLIPVVLDGIIFGLAHFELEQLAGLALFGCILAVVALKTGRLGMNMVAHGTFNLVAVLAILSSRSVILH
ncbi:MAG: lysostaphin resistance A-like protein [Acidimicrobiales bacterium]